MKKILIAVGLISIFISIFTLYLCDASDVSNYATRNYNNSGFNSLSVASGLNLEVKQSEQFEVNAKLNLSGGNIVNIYTTGTLDINASGGSRIYYRGNPKLGKIALSGDSEIQNREK